MDFLLEEWTLYNELQTTLASIESSQSEKDEQLSASQEEQDTAFEEAKDAITECINSQNCELSQSFQPVDVEQIIQTFHLNAGKKPQQTVNIF